MATILEEPFENFAAWIVNSTPAIVAGRHGNAGEINSISDRFEYRLPAASESDTLTVGFAWRTPVLQASHGIVDFASDAGATIHTSLSVGSGGVLLYSRAGSVLASSAAGAVTANAWHYLEVQTKLDDAAGSVAVRVNGTTVIGPLTNLDTRSGGTKTVYDTVRFATPNGSSGGINQIDDLYLGDVFRGDITVPGVWTVLLENFDSVTDWTQAGTTGQLRSGQTGYGWRNAAASSSTLTYAIPGAAESDTIIVGAAQYFAMTATRTLFELRSDAGVTQHITVDVTATGVLEVRRGTITGTVLASSAAGVVTANVWFYAEVKVKLHDTAGTVEAWVNGVQVIAPVSGLDTKLAGTKTTFDAVRLTGSSSPQLTHDDVYIVTGSDAAFLGPQRVGGFDYDVIHEPFDTLTAWTVTGGSPVITTAGRTGKAVDIGSAGGQMQLTFPAPAASKMVVIGFAMYLTDMPTTGAVSLVTYRQGGSVSATALRLDANGVLSLAGSLPSAAGVVQTNRWQYIEQRIMPGGTTAGHTEVRVDGVTVIGPFWDHNFEGPVGSAVDNLRISGGSGVIGSHTYYDDLYVRSGELVDFEGPQAIGPVVTSKLKTWDGDSYEYPLAVKTWDGAAFVDNVVDLKTWNGTAFV